jgi:DNA (cytosine-5)-methyltransferase 1
MTSTGYRHDGSSLGIGDDFCGISGSTRGATQVRYVAAAWGGNHWKPAIDCHKANYPDAEHYHEDIFKADVTKRAYAEIYWASPACPDWSDAKGRKRDFDKQTTQQPNLFGDEPEVDPEVKKNRALMSEVPRYLRAWIDRGRPVLAGVVENVVQCRLWADWDAWLGELHKLGYSTRVIAFNSMHAVAPRSPRAPQSRDRLYVAYWHRSLGRTPDWDKWLRPAAHCARCGVETLAIQVFKKPGRDMGRYGSQYVYICGTAGCGQRVTPPVVPALAVIDPNEPATAIGDRVAKGMDPLEPATLDRIRAGIVRHWLPLLVPCGGTWRDQAAPLAEPMPTRTTRETDGVALPQLVVPVEGRKGKVAAPASQPLRTQTTRLETAVAELPWEPFATPLRGGGDKLRTRPVSEPMHAVTAGGNHHYLAFPPLVMRNFTARGDQGQMTTPAAEPFRTVTAGGKQSVLTWDDQLLVPYYGSTDSARPSADPFGALTAKDRYGLAQPGEFEGLDVEDILPRVRFRMLTVAEVCLTMAFDLDYQVVATAKRTKVRLYGNAVTPPVSELIVSALTEAITGEALPRHRVGAS